MARILAAVTLVTSLAAPAFADDSVATTAAESTIRVQAQLELLPIGSEEDHGGLTFWNNMASAYAISGILDVALTRHLSLGVSPRLVYNITPVGSDAPADKELDLRACIRARTAVSPRFDIYASFSPGYARLLNGDEIFVYTRSGGYTLGAALGFTYDLGSKVFVGGEIGFQRSFMRVDQQRVGEPEDALSYDVELSYVHLGVSVGMGF